MDRKLLTLTFGNFVIATGTMIVPGMLAALARGLDVDIPTAGRLIVVFAAAICIGAPILTAFSGRFERRALLVAVLLSFAAAHALGALAPNYATVMLSRVLCAVGAAMYPALAAASAGALVPPERRGRAVASVFLGFSIASVVGTPLGAWIGESLGWRAGFAVVAGLTLLAAFATHRVLPRGLPTQALGSGAWRRVAGDTTLLLAIAVTAVQAWAQFTVFSYLTPAFRDFVDAGPSAIAGLLAVFGVTGILGNIVAAKLMDRVGPARVVLVALCCMAAAQVAWFFAPGSWGVLVLSLALWGLGCFAVNSGQQVRLIGLAPLIGPVAVALNSSALYLGMAVGAETGARLLHVTGTARLALVSAPIFIAAIALSHYVAGRSRQPA